MAICLASPATTSGSTPTLPPPKTSPESFNITRLYGPFTRGVLSALWELLLRAGRLEACESQAVAGCLVKLRAERHLGIGDRWRIEEGRLPEVPARAAVAA